MKQLKYIGNHRPKGMVIELDDSNAEEALKSGKFVLNSEVLEENSEYEEKKPNINWTEKEIYVWIKKNNIPIKYSISNTLKSEILDKLKYKGYI